MSRQTFLQHDMRLMSQIADRTVEMATQYGLEYIKRDALMDIDFAHRDIPLRLPDLLSADDSNFAHDVFGIRRHLNRQTLKIENCFMPRYAQRNEVI